MGADTFVERGKGKSAKEVFNKLVEQAAYDHGHGGYTGTIAEKSEYTFISAPTESMKRQILAKMVEKVNKGIEWQKAQKPSVWQKEALVEAEAKLTTLLTSDPASVPNTVEEYAAYLIDEGDERVDDKWGPAGCLCVKEPENGEPGEWIFFGWASS